MPRKRFTIEEDEVALILRLFWHQFPIRFQVKEVQKYLKERSVDSIRDRYFKDNRLIGKIYASSSSVEEVWQKLSSLHKTIIPLPDFSDFQPETYKEPSLKKTS